MTPYQWTGTGPIWRTGSMLIVMKPSGPGLSGTTAIMRAPGGRMHLEDAVSTSRSDPLHTEPEARQPAGQRVGAEVALDDEGGRRARFEPGDPALQQVVQPGLAEADRRVRIHASELQGFRHGIGLRDHDVGRAGSLGVAGAEVEGPMVHIDRPDAGVGLAERHGDCD